MSNWIKISTHKPVPNENILFTDGDYTYFGFMSELGTFYQKEDEICIKRVETTHWMPFPKPPGNHPVRSTPPNTTNRQRKSPI